jgi:prepilin-type processing-associated H-X9-DG protein
MPAMMQVTALNDLSWTKGETVTVGGNAFLVTYRLNTGLDPASIASPAPKLVASLTLNLLRTDSITSIAPVPGMTPDQLRKTLAAAGVTLDQPPLMAEETSSDEATTAAVLFPVFAQAKVAAKQTATLSNAKQIAIGALMYCGDYDDVFPFVQSTPQFQKVTHPYTKNPDIWKTLNPNGGEFRFAMNMAGVSMTTLDNPAEAPLIYESQAWPDGRRTVAFVDGHAKRVSAAEWAAIEPRLRAKHPRTAKWPIKVK